MMRPSFNRNQCGPALVNKRWDEGDQWHCSPFNTAAGGENNGYSLQPLSLSPPALAHENTIHDSSPWQQMPCGVEMYTVPAFSPFCFPSYCHVVKKEVGGWGDSKENKRLSPVSPVVFRWPVSCNYTSSDRQLALLIST